MQFCKRGHDAIESGRTKWGDCSVCYNEKHPRSGPLSKGLCRLGHDTNVHGRNKSRECNLCRIETNRRHAWKGFLNNDGTQFRTVDYDRAYQIQGGKCAICGRHQSILGKTLEVDHDHSTMLVRGLLCAGCNMHLGKFEQIRDAAENYLKNNLSKAPSSDPTGT